jgi:hypothetical protein
VNNQLIEEEINKPADEYSLVDGEDGEDHPHNQDAPIQIQEPTDHAQIQTN